MHRRRLSSTRLIPSFGFLLVALLAISQDSAMRLAAQCGPNPIACENQLTGNPKSEWDVSGSGDSSIQGFATDISANRGDTVHFKVSTTAASFRIDIYRLGYYAGLGARKIATISNVTGQVQPSCLVVSNVNLVDCGNWSESATWAVPATAVSGIYLARLTRPDTGGASHVVFVVRDDSSTSDLLFQTSDTTWQAYNGYGGWSLYFGPARKVSYNRPFVTRGQTSGYGTSNWVFYAEYPMLRWLEANGYNVSYSSAVDTDRRGALIKNHKTFLSVGHDEYWSGAQRANVEAARAAGVNLAFFGGNESLWKTRWETSVDGTATPYRTLVCYKETSSNKVTDPADPPIWTGTWRDPRFSPPADGGRPENAVSGQISTVNRGSAAITVPSSDSALRFWRNTAIAALTTGQSVTLATNTLGYEWDEDLDNGARPAGLMRMSSTTVNVPQYLVDFGTTTAPSTRTHALTLYKHASGALIFGAGTVQWAWGLDPIHDTSPDTGSATADLNMQQATLNVLADMGAQPATRQINLYPASPSTDVAPPASIVQSPNAGAMIPAGSVVTISGTASDAGGGVVAGVEVTVDGGTTWHPATGGASWSYTWVPGSLGTATIMSRAVDDSGNLEQPVSSVLVTVTNAVCPCSIWNDGVSPWNVDANDAQAVELGVKFQSDINGLITGLRFYKAAANTGVHTGHLWTTGGQLLGTLTFSNESASGWQQASFATPIAVTAGTTYVASYYTTVGHYSIDIFYFGRTSTDQWPLHALASPLANGNGVYQYGASAYPSKTYQSANYWVDVVFAAPSADTTPPSVTGTTPPNGSTGISPATTVTAQFSELLASATINTNTFTLTGPGGAAVPATVAYSSGTNTATLTPVQPLATATSYSAAVIGGASGVTDTSGNALPSTVTWSFTTSASPPPSSYTIWNTSAAPGHFAADSNAVEIGLRFRADVNGTVTGVRFYKGSTNTGVHVGNLWSNAGTLLATGTFANETSSGWQQLSFSTPVAIVANTTYVVSYHTATGNYAVDNSYFAAGGVDSPPLHALADGVDGSNGVYLYGASAFPTQTYHSSNYWVDVVFSPSGADTTPPTVIGVAPGNGATGVSPSTAVTAQFSESIAASTLTTGTFVLRTPANTIVPATVSYASGTNTATLQPTQPLAVATAYTATVAGGSGGVTDLAGNALAASVSWSFTTAANAQAPVSIWAPSTIPSRISTDSNAVEVGMRFRSDAGGTITAIRFYKGAANTGTHVANLWTNGGTLLATATFTNETASGWQQVNLSTPVAISANTTYVVSYHTTTGGYAVDNSYFSGSGVDTPPLHALVDGASGSNGVYLYGAGAFPTQTYLSSNYWVDVVFVPN